MKWHIHTMLKQSCGPLCGLIFSTSINYNKSVHKRACNTFFQTIFKNGLLLISSLLGKWLQHWLENRLTSQTYYMYLCKQQKMLQKINRLYGYQLETQFSVFAKLGTISYHTEMADILHQQSIEGKSEVRRELA